MRRPGILRFSASAQAMNPACGPPKPIGTPKRCDEPMQMSAPNSPGAFRTVSASKSAATIVTAPAALALAKNSAKSSMRPRVSGYCTNTANNPSHAAGAKVCQSPVITSMPNGSARVTTTSIVCGWQRSETKIALPFGLPARAKLIASAAAVPSSSSEALETSSPVRSVIIVWKFSKASNRPCAISA